MSSTAKNQKSEKKSEKNQKNFFFPQKIRKTILQDIVTTQDIWTK